MKRPGQVLLISCYELGHQPLGLALPAAFLQRAGYLPDLLDLAVQKMDFEKIKKARFIGISVPMHTALRIGKEVAVRIREVNPGCHISFYGLYASLNGAALLKGEADSVIGGEYEGPLLALIECLAQGDTPTLPGVHTRNQSAEPHLAHLPFPTPNREGLPPLTQYAHLIEGSRERQVGYVEASRGCRHLCRHCPIPPVYGGRFFVFPKERVLDDIANLAALGATHITFGDPDFLNGPTHSLRIARSLHKRFPILTFDFTAKVEHLLQYQNLLREFSELGCIFIVSAVESMSDLILKQLVKQHSRADIIRVFQILKEIGIALRPSLVPFTPWTTLADLTDLFETIENEGMIAHVDPVQYTIRLLIPPGSLLLPEPTMASALGPLDPLAFTYSWTHEDPRIDALQKRFSEEVEQGLENEKAPEAIFYQLKEYADAARERRDPRRIETRATTETHVVPRLSEPWFCCAEPTANQISSVRTLNLRGLDRS